jgi:hypothetical protein
MPVYARDTDSTYTIRFAAAIRCFWSEIFTTNGSEVWMRVETQMVKDGTPADIIVYLVDPNTHKRTAKLDELSETLSDNALEHKYRVQLTKEQMEANHGHTVLVFEASVGPYSLTGVSQELHLAQPRYSI